MDLQMLRVAARGWWRRSVGSAIVLLDVPKQHRRWV